MWDSESRDRTADLSGNIRPRANSGLPSTRSGLRTPTCRLDESPARLEQLLQCAVAQPIHAGEDARVAHVVRLQIVVVRLRVETQVALDEAEAKHHGLRLGLFVGRNAREHLPANRQRRR